jgi:hypothetical protein
MAICPPQPERPLTDAVGSVASQSIHRQQPQRMMEATRPATTVRCSIHQAGTEPRHYILVTLQPV